MQNSIVIYRNNGAGNMYLCRDGTLTSDANASNIMYAWESQFASIISEHWICTHGGIACYQFV